MWGQRVLLNLTKGDITNTVGQWKENYFKRESEKDWKRVDCWERNLIKIGDCKKQGQGNLRVQHVKIGAWGRRRSVN